MFLCKFARLPATVRSSSSLYYNSTRNTSGLIKRSIFVPKTSFIINAPNRTHFLGLTAPLQETRRNFIFQRRHNKLLKDATENPLDATKQWDLLTYYMQKKQYGEVINWVESGKYTIDERSKSEYFKALVLVGKIEKLLSKIPPANGDLNQPGSLDQTSQHGPTPFADLGQQVFHVKVLRSYGETVMVILPTLLGIGFLIMAGVAVYYASTQSSGALPFSIPPAHQEVWNVETKFKDVMGIDEAKHELQEVVEYLKDSQKFLKLGAQLPKGVLLVGEPGCGKTLLARALAGEAGVPFLYTTGASFDEMFVGVGPKRIRTLFEDAKKLAPCIVFIDEIDSVGSNRKNSYNSGAREATLNQLLTEMDGFKNTHGIIVIGATNFVESLDPALLRPGRFDKHVFVPVPDVKGRKEILDLYLKKTVVDSTVDSAKLARGTPGWSGADLANLVNLAAIKATMAGKSKVDIHSLEDAKDQIVMGLARRNKEKDPQALKVTAYHEGGHALVALYTDGAIPLHKATIMQRGGALGVTVMLPEKDDVLVSRKKLLASIAVSMGGRAAEELIFGEEEVTSGATSDFKKATSIAYQMVAQYGMSKRVGTMYHSFKNPDQLSEQEQSLIDQEVKEILQKSYETSKKLLKDHEVELHRLAKALLEHETLSVEEIKAVIQGKTINKQI